MYFSAIQVGWYPIHSTASQGLRKEDNEGSGHLALIVAIAPRCPSCALPTRLRLRFRCRCPARSRATLMAAAPALLRLGAICASTCAPHHAQNKMAIRYAE